MIDSDRLVSILTLKGAFGVQNACALCDSGPRRSVLRTTLRASIGSRARLGSKFRPLLLKYNVTPVCNQDLTEYHESKHSRKMFFDNV